MQISIVTPIIAFLLLLSMFAVTGSFIHSGERGVLALQFPKSQQLDLSAVNSGKPPGTDNFKISEGYRIEAVAWNLTLPSSVTFDNNTGTMYVAQAGYAYGGLQPQPLVLKVEQNGNTSIFVDRMLNGPITDIEFHDGKLYVSHKGIISTVDPANGLIKDIIVDLPSLGDHHNNQIAFGSDGRMYFGQGVATNSGVVGEDSAAFGWLKIAPLFHDTPGNNITLTGQNFNASNPLTIDPKYNKSATGAFVPFDNTTDKDQVIPGSVKCSGCIISANPDGTDLKVVAWGLRNPYGLAFGEDGKKLVVSNNGADERGSRPIANDTDRVYTIDDISNSSALGKFYGWPDFYGNGEPVTDPQFKSPRGKEPLQFLMQDHPPVQKPLAQLEVGVGSTQIAIPNANSFGLEEGMAFVGEFGTTTPIAHTPKPMPAEKIIGQKVVMVNLQNGNVTDFVSLKTPDPTFRPMGIKFNDKEGALYVTSAGKVEVREALPNGTPLPMPTPWGYAHTGVIWKISQASSTGNTTQN